MEKFNFTNSIGEKIEFNYTDDFIIESYEGLSASDIITSTFRGFTQNGYSIFNTNLGERIITINFYIYADNMENFYKKKRKVIKIFNPLLGEGTLTYTNDYISKSIKCICSTQPEPNEKMGSLQLFTLELTCANPLWFDNEESALKMGGFVGGLNFPLVFKGDGVTFANKGEISNITINGDVPSPIKAVFKNESLNPVLTLENTGEFISVKTKIEDGEELVINTAYGNKTVEHKKLDGTIENAYHLITLDSSFFNLKVGNNRLSFIAEFGTPEVYLYWRNYYTGV